MSLPSYKSPPLIEVVYGISFKLLPRFKAPFLGFLWEKFRDDFPEVENAPPLGLESEYIDVNNFSFVRTWFIHKDKHYLIQIQNDRFLFNWRKLDEDESSYPRHDVVFDLFNKYFEVFKEFISENQLGEIVSNGYELTYINHIEQKAAWNELADVGNVINFFQWHKDKRYLPVPKFLSFSLGFEIPDSNGKVTIKLNPGLTREHKSPVLMLEIDARYAFGDDIVVDFDYWFKLSRETIVKSFEDITNEEIQTKLWKKVT